MIIDEFIWHKLEKLYYLQPEIKCVNSTDKQIRDAEQEIGSMFSDLYRYYLKHHQVILLNTWKMYELHDPTNEMNDNFVVQATRLFRRNHHIPYDYRKWFIIGCHYEDKVNLLAMNKRREIWCLHDTGLSGADKLADNFEEFLHQNVIHQ